MVLLPVSSSLPSFFLRLMVAGKRIIKCNSLPPAPECASALAQAQLFDNLLPSYTSSPQRPHTFLIDNNTNMSGHHNVWKLWSCRNRSISKKWCAFLGIWEFSPFGGFCCTSVCATVQFNPLLFSQQCCHSLSTKGGGGNKCTNSFNNQSKDKGTNQANHLTEQLPHLCHQINKLHSIHNMQFILVFRNFYRCCCRFHHLPILFDQFR